MNQAATQTASTENEYHGASAAAGKYLTLFLGNEAYGIDVLQVSQIIRLPPITEVPTSTERIAGVINLRGRVVPVVDLRDRMGMMRVEATRNTCVVIVEVCGRTTGLIVDRVFDVTTVNEANIESFPPVEADVNVRYIRAVVKRESGLLMLLELEQVLGVSK